MALSKLRLSFEVLQVRLMYVSHMLLLVGTPGVVHGHSLQKADLQTLKSEGGTEHGMFAAYCSEWHHNLLVVGLCHNNQLVQAQVGG